MSAAVLLDTPAEAGDVVDVAVTRADGVTLVVRIARRVAARAAAVAEALARTGLPFALDVTPDRFGLVVTDGPEGLDVPAGVKYRDGAVGFTGKGDDAPDVVPLPADFPDVLPGSYGPLAAAVQLVVGLPITGYLSVEDGAAVANLNAALGLEHGDAFTTATALALADHLAPRRSTKGATR